jgi:hypothetical protein
VARAVGVVTLSRAETEEKPRLVNLAADSGNGSRSRLAVSRCSLRADEDALEFGQPPNPAPSRSDHAGRQSD